jgi:hypothetical protein
MPKKIIVLSVITSFAVIIAGCASTGDNASNSMGPKFGKGKKGMRSGAGRSQSRSHTATTKEDVVLVSAEKTLTIASIMQETVSNTIRSIKSNGIPTHKIGAFPNRNNPNRIKARDYQFEMTTKPHKTNRITRSERWYWGVAMNGVPFQAQTAEFWKGEMGGWGYDALGGAVPLGLDENNAHVQPTGAYHYHGIPVGLMQQLGWKANQHSPQIGWAADGFAVYSLTGDLGNGVKMLSSSYQLKQGERPGGSNNPSGTYDGTFNQDWEYVAGTGDLDECNGAVTYSDEFPEGSYAYFLTNDHPFLSRCWKGTPNRSFRTNINQ